MLFLDDEVMGNRLSFVIFLEGSVVTTVGFWGGWVTRTASASLDRRGEDCVIGPSSEQGMSGWFVGTERESSNDQVENEWMFLAFLEV